MLEVDFLEVVACPPQIHWRSQRQRRRPRKCWNLGKGWSHWASRLEAASAIQRGRHWRLCSPPLSPRWRWSIMMRFSSCILLNLIPNRQNVGCPQRETATQTGAEERELWQPTLGHPRLRWRGRGGARGRRRWGREAADLLGESGEAETTAGVGRSGTGGSLGLRRGGALRGGGGGMGTDLLIFCFATLLQRIKN